MGEMAVEHRHTVEARELTSDSEALVARLKRGERLILTHSGSPIAFISPITSDEAQRPAPRESADAEGVAWLAASEGAFGFWDNTEDAVWDAVEPRA